MTLMKISIIRNMALVLCLLCLVFPCTQCTRPYDIQFETEEYDCGDIIEGSIVEFPFLFTNTGRERITIIHVQPSCPCTIVSDWDRALDPGKTGMITVRFETPELRGQITKAISVKTNIPGKELIQLFIKGNVIIPVDVFPRSLWLGDVDDKTAQLSGSFNIINNTNAPFRILEITQPDININFILTTLEENRTFSLDFVILPPFGGREKIGNTFVLRTNMKEYEKIELKFYYFRKP